MIGREKACGVARLLSAAAGLALCSAASLAQSNDPLDQVELDPSAPLDPLPDLGVDWPTLDAPAAATDPATRSEAAAPAADLRYAVALEGLLRLGEAEEISTAFRAQSALEADRDKIANAAQLDRRSRSDAELLAELLRSRGYYDATAEPHVETVAGRVQVLLRADAGEQYQFDSKNQIGGSPTEDRVEPTHEPTPAENPS